VYLGFLVVLLLILVHLDAFVLILARSLAGVVNAPYSTPSFPALCSPHTSTRHYILPSFLVSVFPASTAPTPNRSGYAHYPALTPELERDHETDETDETH
jgi:hypothetical protein